MSGLFQVLYITGLYNVVSTSVPHSSMVKCEVSVYSVDIHIKNTFM